MINERSDVKFMKDLQATTRSAIMTFLGALLFMITVFFHIETREVIMTLVISGGCLFFLGMSGLMSRPMKLVFLPTGSRIKYHSIFFSQKDLDNILTIIDDGSFFEHELTDRVKEEGNVQIGILLSKDKRFAAILVGLYEYESYKPLRSVACFCDEHANAISDFLKKHKQKIN